MSPARVLVMNMVVVFVAMFELFVMMEVVLVSVIMLVVVLCRVLRKRVKRGDMRHAWVRQLVSDMRRDMCSGNMSRHMCRRVMQCCCLIMTRVMRLFIQNHIQGLGKRMGQHTRIMIVTGLLISGNAIAGML
eukprot:CAMPEP_0185581150 /NCGR_PEP_ID=MMETSP0434-20130131/18134_1 /TAXON_ID=626734 ORGANISM="Favella taraikaensis, Strain Fe Narragansett Bay" /NCGR_SAMPLE_ID=MMETSP0434 /ASSEMBLY_ACC=CAM_ASM_000379 /LENGTH=131 /DNA_ID=CAMNT_0028199619 /DNA_START=1094 /DNA_END=1486 /DNA_ORIENTATION=+